MRQKWIQNLEANRQTNRQAEQYFIETGFYEKGKICIVSPN